MKLANRRKRIVLLGAPLDNYYTGEFWRGAVNAAQAEDLDLIFLAGGVQVNYFENVAPTNSVSEARSTLLYQLLDKKQYDGVLVWGAQWGHDVDLETIQAILYRFLPLPIVSVGTAHEKTWAIMVDNYSGMYQVIDHLVTVHGHRKIVYFKSDLELGQGEAAARYQAYCDVLANHGIPLDETLLVGAELIEKARKLVGDNSRSIQWGTLGMEYLLDTMKLKPGVDFTAMVARDDLTALNAAAVLRLRDYQIPRDVAISGFDDIIESRCNNPPLTTVGQSFADQAAKAVHALAALMRGETLARNTTINTATAIFRESCGCPNRFLERYQYITSQRPKADSVERLAESMETIPTEVRLKSAKDLWDSLHLVLGAKALVTDFLAHLESIMTEMFQQGFDVMECMVLLSGMQVEVNQGHNQVEREQAQHLLQTAFLVGGDILNRLQIFERKVSQERQTRMETLGQNITRSYELSQAMDTIEGELPIAAIPGCYIVLFKDPANPLDQGNLCFAVSKYQRYQTVQFPGLEFAVKYLLPEAFMAQKVEAQSLIVSPLNFGAQRFGYLILEKGTSDSRMYYNLSLHISSVLAGSFLVKNLGVKQQQLELAYKEILELSNRDALTGLSNRRAFQKSLQDEKNRVDRYLAREKAGFSLIFIDLDNFKYLNDNCGHDAGDAGLKAFAEHLLELTRLTDVVARYGGDEFVLLLPETNVEGAAILAQRIHDGLRRKNHLQSRMQEHLNRVLIVPDDKKLFCSMGITTYQKQISIETLLKQADIALYQAKRDGRACYRVADCV